MYNEMRRSPDASGQAAVWQISFAMVFFVSEAGKKHHSKEEPLHRRKFLSRRSQHANSFSSLQFVVAARLWVTAIGNEQSNSSIERCGRILAPVQPSCHSQPRA